MTFLPSTRLLWLVFAVVLLAVPAGPMPGLMPVCFAALAIVVLLALLDLALSLRGVRMPGVSIPDVVRFSKDRPGVIPVSFSNETGRAMELRFALGLPKVFAAKDNELWVRLPAGAKKSRAQIEWACTPSRRGRFANAALACCEAGSRMGLWRLRARARLECELRVYPNLFSERRQLAAVFLDRGQFGAKLQRTVGRGREFEKMREYLPGDGFDEIHWKATAKRGHPVTKVFQAERTQEIYVVIDMSRLSGRLVTHEGVTQTVLERYLTSALVLFLAAQRQGDRFGVIAYDDRVRVSLRAGNGAAHYAACREALHTLQPGEVTPDMAEVARHIRLRQRQRALLFFLTDLSDPVLAEDFARHAPLLARQHLMLVSQLRGPGVEPLFANKGAEGRGDLYARLAGHMRWEEMQALIRTLKQNNITAAVLDDDAFVANLVTQYLQVKRRQLL
ncbi:DUF58 domain-containing protein [Ereboglobus luteus]|uniref:DUF58 domain-containing protein n=1 Tax=Ereboglobus luteus TaxID=1796921 RepID=A0A2U8E545_9BACT|nr:DUF58 domain-containing protein [Ereboglobus luteus]AWI09971.1 hypothetical protein CKA38_12575 [Ereboglobus luteus]